MVAEIVGWEVLVPLALIALLFGGSRIPELARSLGRARREFSEGLNGSGSGGTDERPETERSGPT